MRFACQSCGKAYNLPEEKIADKSNVKLKCRVCGAIVEVKKQGEVVAAILDDGENKRGRVSEAPAPLTSMMPDDSDDATHAIAVSDQILAEGASGEDAASALMGHVKSALGQRGIAPLPPPPPTGFGSPPPAGFGSPSASGFGAPAPPGFGQGPPPGFAPTPVPPPLSVPELPRAEPPPFARPDAAAPPLPPSLGSGPGSPPPPLPNAEHGLQAGSHGSLQNGSNGAAARFGEAVLSDDPLPPPMASVAMSGAMSMGGGAAMSMGGAAAMSMGGAAAMSPLASGDMGSYSGTAPLDMQPAQPGDTTRKMLAALATGILIGFIIARLFF